MSEESRGKERKEGGGIEKGKRTGEGRRDSVTFHNKADFAHFSVKVDTPL